MVFPHPIRYIGSGAAFVIIETDAFSSANGRSKRRRCGHNVLRFLFQHLSHRELCDVEKAQQLGRDQGMEVLGRKVRKGLSR